MSRRGHGAVYIRHAADKHGGKRESGEDPWCLLCAANLRLEGRTFVRLSESDGPELQSLISRILGVESQGDFPSNDVCSKCERTLRRLSRQQTSAAARSEAERLRASFEAILRRHGQEPVPSEEGLKFWEAAVGDASGPSSGQGRARLGKVASAVGSFRRKGSLDKNQRGQQQKRLGSDGSSLDRRDSNASVESVESSTSGRSNDAGRRQSSDVISEVFAPSPSAGSGSEPAKVQGDQQKWGRSSKYTDHASTPTPPVSSLASSPRLSPASLELLPAAPRPLVEDPALSELDRGESDGVLSGLLGAPQGELAAPGVDDFEPALQLGDHSIGDRVSASSETVIKESEGSLFREVGTAAESDSSFSVGSFPKDLSMETSDLHERCVNGDNTQSKAPGPETPEEKSKTRTVSSPTQSKLKGQLHVSAKSDASPGGGGAARGVPVRGSPDASKVPRLGSGIGKPSPALVPRNAAKQALPRPPLSPASKKGFGFVASQMVGVNRFSKKALASTSPGRRTQGGLPRPVETRGASSAARGQTRKPQPAVRSILKKAGEEKGNSHLEEYGIAKSVSFTDDVLEDGTQDSVGGGSDSPMDVDSVHQQLDEHFCFLEGAYAQDPASPGRDEHNKENLQGGSDNVLDSETKSAQGHGHVMDEHGPCCVKDRIATIELSEATLRETLAESNNGKDTAVKIIATERSLPAMHCVDFTSDTLQTLGNNLQGTGKDSTGTAGVDGGGVGPDKKHDGRETGEGTLAEQMEIQSGLETYVLEESRVGPGQIKAAESTLADSQSRKKNEVSRFIFPGSSFQNSSTETEDTTREFGGSEVEAGNIGNQGVMKGMGANQFRPESLTEGEPLPHGEPLKVSSPKERKIPTLQMHRKTSLPPGSEQSKSGISSTAHTSNASATDAAGGQQASSGVIEPEPASVHNLIGAFEVISKMRRQAGFPYEIASPGSEVRRSTSDVTHDAVRKWRRSALPLPKLGTRALAQSAGSGIALADSTEPPASSSSSGGGAAGDEAASSESFYSVATWPRHSGIPKATAAHGQRAPILGRRQITVRTSEDKAKKHKSDEAPLIANEVAAEQGEAEEDDEEDDENKDNDNEMPFDFFKKKAKEAPAEDSAAVNAGADTADSKTPLKSEQPVENGTAPATAPKPDTKTQEAKPADQEADGGTAPASKTAPESPQDQGHQGGGDAKAEGEAGQVKQMDIKEPRSENSPLIEKESKLKDAQPGFLCCTIM